MRKRGGSKRMHLRDVEILTLFWTLEVDQGWKQQDHVPPLIHDRCATVGTADFAGELVHGGLVRALVPAQVVMAVGEVDVVFVKDGCPLERCSCRTVRRSLSQETVVLAVYLLTRRAMTEFRVQWLFSAQLVLDSLAMTASLVADVEVWIVVVDLVRGSELPLIEVPLSTPLVTVVPVGSVCGCVGHSPSVCVKV